MQIYIFDEKIDKNDGIIIQLLDSSPFFQEKLGEIRKKFSIPKKGFDCASASLKGNYLSDSSGKKLKLAKSFPKEKTKRAYAYMTTFLDDPDIAISGKGEFRKEIEEIRKFFNLEKRWYHPICHLVLFSVPGWLHSPITALIKKPAKKDLWNRQGATIQVSENITKTELCNWIRENWDEVRDRMEKELNIRKKSKKSLPRKHPINLLKRIIAAKESGVRLSEIAKRISTSQEEYDFLTDLQNLSNIVSRYSLKTSRKK